MPIPLLFIGIGAGLGALGVGKGIKAGIDTSEANQVNENANDIIKNSQRSLDKARKASGTALEILGTKKLNILDKDINNFIEAFEKIKNIEIQTSIGFDELNKFKIDKQSFVNLKEMGGYASSILGGAAGGAMTGALTAFGAYGAAMTFASASTGTAIATLSGAAATNATLAFFGGGALAAGGLGMAGGAAVLGGLVAGPALAIMGFVVGAKASANKDQAYSNLAEARKLEEECAVAIIACEGIRRRAYMFQRLLIRADAMFTPLVSDLQNIVAKNDDYRSYTETEKHVVAATASLAGTIKAVLDTPILTEDGQLTEESKEIAEAVSKTLQESI